VGSEMCIVDREGGGPRLVPARIVSSSLHALDCGLMGDDPFFALTGVEACKGA